MHNQRQIITDTKFGRKKRRMTTDQLFKRIVNYQDAFVLNLL